MLSVKNRLINYIWSSISITIACLICIGTQYEIQPNILALAITLVTTGGALLGLGVFDNKNSNNQLKSE
jgi:hypothetical protein